MKRTTVPGTTTRFFGIVLLLICTAGLSHYSQIFQRQEDMTQFQQRHLQQYLENIRALNQILKDDRQQLMDARIKTPVFVNHSDQASVQAARNLQDYYLSEFKNSLIVLACLLESASNSKFACEDFSVTIMRMKDQARLRRVDYQYTEMYKMQTELFANRLCALQWVVLRNDQSRQRIIYGFLLLQIWGIWMITYGEMLSRSPRIL